MGTNIGNIKIKGIEKGLPKLKADGFVVPFYQTKKSLKDLEVYNNFIKEIEKLVRRSKEYKAYKSFLMKDMGLNFCVVFPNITSDLGGDDNSVTIEMHHGPILTLYDCCAIVVDHLLANNKAFTSFDVAKIIIQEHEEHNIQVVMVCDLVHKLCHTKGSYLYINPKQAWGRLDVFLTKYKDGLTDKRKTIINKNLELSQQYHSIDREGILNAYRAKRWDNSSESINNKKIK